MEGRRAIDLVVVPFTHETKASTWERDPKLREAATRFDLWGRSFSGAAELVERMDEVGVERALVPAITGGAWEVSYDYVRSFVETSPARLYGTAGIDPSDIARGVQKLDRAVRELAFVGVAGFAFAALPRQAEIGQVDVLATARLLRQQHVRRLHVPVHEVTLMRSVERARGLTEKPKRPLRFERTLRLDKRTEVGAFDETHRDVQLTSRLARVIDRDDVRVIDRRRHPRLVQKPLSKPLVLCQIRRNQLQRNRTIQRNVVGPIHDTHPATADQRLDPVAGDLRADPRVSLDRHETSLERAGSQSKQALRMTGRSLRLG